MPTGTAVATTIMWNQENLVSYQPQPDSNVNWRTDDIEENAAYSNNPSASLTIKFSGFAASFWAAPKHDRHILKIEVDGVPMSYADERPDAPNPPVAQLLWNATFEDGPHTLLAYTDGQGGPNRTWVAFTKLVYLSGDVNATTTSTVPPSTIAALATRPASASTGSGEHKISTTTIVAVAVGVTVGALVVAGVFFAYFCFRRRRNNRVCYESPQQVLASEVLELHSPYGPQPNYHAGNEAIRQSLALQIPPIATPTLSRHPSIATTPNIFYSPPHRRSSMATGYFFGSQPHDDSMATGASQDLYYSPTVYTRRSEPYTDSDVLRRTPPYTDIDVPRQGSDADEMEQEVDESDMWRRRSSIRSPPRYER